MKQTLLISAALIVGLVAAIAGGLLYRQQQPPEAPAFTLPDLDGQPQSIARWHGRVIVLNFWGSWCPPCVREIPMLVALQDEYGERGLQVIGVAVDRPEEARTFAQKLGMNYPILYGKADALAVSTAYGNASGTLPYTVVIDRDGRIRARFSTELEREQLTAALSPLL